MDMNLGVKLLCSVPHLLGSHSRLFFSHYVIFMVVMYKLNHVILLHTSCWPATRYPSDFTAHCEWLDESSKSLITCFESENMDCDDKQLLLHTEVRWLPREELLLWVFELWAQTDRTLSPKRSPLAGVFTDNTAGGQIGIPVWYICQSKWA